MTSAGLRVRRRAATPAETAERARVRGNIAIGPRPAANEGTLPPAEAVERSVARAVIAEQLTSARRVNLIRFLGVTLFAAIFLVVGGALGLRDWQGNVFHFLPYWLATALLYVVGRKRDRIARFAGWSVAVVDMPIVFLLQWTTFDLTRNVSAVAGYTLGIYVLLVVVEALSLNARRIYISAAVGASLQALLLHLAGSDRGAIFATFVLMGIAAVSCAHATRRITTLIRRIAVDLSERRRVEEAVRARDDFLSVASHELKTPLTSLQLNVESLARLMRRRDAVNTPSASVLARIDAADASALRLGQLIDHLLDVSRIRSGQLELQLQPVDLTRVARFVVEQLGDGLARAGCPVTVVAPPEVIGQWDRLRVEQVVTNLVSNAMKYGGGAPIEIEVFATAAHGQITVRDHGIGISNDDLGRIFDRFERAASAKHVSGLGLGLWISAQIVRAMGGDIQVESQRGEGSLFRVTLPLRPAPPVSRPVLAPVREANG